MECPVSVLSAERTLIPEPLGIDAMANSTGAVVGPDDLRPFVGVPEAGVLNVHESSASQGTDQECLELLPRCRAWGSAKPTRVGPHMTTRRGLSPCPSRRRRRTTRTPSRTSSPLCDGSAGGIRFLRNYGPGPRRRARCSVRARRGPRPCGSHTHVDPDGSIHVAPASATGDLARASTRPRCASNEAHMPRPNEVLLTFLWVAGW